MADEVMDDDRMIIALIREAFDREWAREQESPGTGSDAPRRHFDAATLSWLVPRHADLLAVMARRFDVRIRKDNRVRCLARGYAGRFRPWFTRMVKAGLLTMDRYGWCVLSD
jgi:hypothetical protein